MVMFTAALIGPDGSGKSTVSERLQKECPLPIRRIYMGINTGESNIALPTTRFLEWLRVKLKRGGRQGGPRDASVAEAPPKNPIKRVLKEIKSALMLLNRIADEWYRQLVVWYFVRRNIIVLFDRHFFIDYYHYDIQGKQKHWTNRVHGYLLEKVYPRPNLVIFLDAPAEVLFARKGEGTVSLLEKRRQEYLSLRGQFPRFEVVDASQPSEKVVSDVLAILLDHAQSGG